MYVYVCVWQLTCPAIRGNNEATTIYNNISKLQSKSLASKLFTCNNNNSNFNYSDDNNSNNCRKQQSKSIEVSLACDRLNCRDDDRTREVAAITTTNIEQQQISQAIALLAQ